MQGLITKGKYGPIYIVSQCCEGPLLFAMKIYEKQVVHASYHVQQIQHERQLLERLQHPFVTSIHYAFQDHSHLVMIQGYAERGNLYDFMNTNRIFNEE